MAPADPPEAGFWSWPLARLQAELAAGPEGLSDEEARRRLQRHGPNDTTATPRPPAWRSLARRFRNPLLIILLLVALFCALAGDAVSFALVFTIVLLSVAMDFIQERRADNALAELSRAAAPKARVRRDGAVTVMPAEGLVPGDLVLLAAGDVIPADGRLLEAASFQVDQAHLTGEPYPVARRRVDAPEPARAPEAAEGAVLAGSAVTSGSAILLVCRTGKDTALGGLACRLAERAPPSAYQLGTRHFGRLILRLTVLLVALVTAIGILFHRPWLLSLLFAFALAAGLTPELLPMIVTTAFARGARRLAAKGVLVKQLTAIHNLGAMDLLCLDKTGTLTEGRIRLLRCIDATGEESLRVAELAGLNSRFLADRTSPLDAAILAGAGEPRAGPRKLAELGFDFERRRASVLLEDGSERILIVKGAFESVLPLCRSSACGNGPAETLSPDLREALVQLHESLSSQGLRSLAVARRVVPTAQSSLSADDESDLEFAGFALFADPPKPSAGAALNALAQAGIAVKIMTGDSPAVTAALAGGLGLPVEGSLDGDALEAMSEEDLDRRLAGTSLFARVSPQQKLRLLLALKRSGRTVGFLGDGINDAPALHAADVGISVDNAAGVARAAATVVLLKPDLQVLHAGALEGRRTVVNAEKYILTSGSINFGHILSMTLASLLLPYFPLLPAQLLLAGLLFDLAQAALPFDAVDAEALGRPLRWDIRLIERFMLTMGPVGTLFDLGTFAVLLVIFQADMALFRTGWFIETLVTQLLMILVLRSRRFFLASRPHPALLALVLGLCALALLLPFSPAAPWFEFVQPPAAYYGFLALAAASFLAAVEGMKRLFYGWIAGIRR